MFSEAKIDNIDIILRNRNIRSNNQRIKQNLSIYL